MNDPFSFERVNQMLGLSVSGNSVVDNFERDEGNRIAHVDSFLCTACGFPVKEEEFIANHNCCKECWADYCEEQICRHKEE